MQPRRGLQSEKQCSVCKQVERGSSQAEEASGSCCFYPHPGGSKAAVGERNGNEACFDGEQSRSTSAAPTPDPAASHSRLGPLLKERDGNVSYYVWNTILSFRLILKQFSQRSSLTEVY